MKTFESEVEFKKFLDTLGVRYGDLDNTWKFYVEFVDNKGACLVSYSVARTPVGALRSIPKLLKESNLPPDDLDIVVRFAFRTTVDSIEYVTINSIISPYMYYKKQDVDKVSPEGQSSE